MANNEKKSAIVFLRVSPELKQRLQTWARALHLKDAEAGRLALHQWVQKCDEAEGRAAEAEKIAVNLGVAHG